MDRSTILGLLVALAGLALAVALEGGQVRQIIQPTAALVVCGGTLGAVMVQFPHRVLRQSCKDLKWLFVSAPDDTITKINELVDLGSTARKHGIVSLDYRLSTLDDPFLKRALMLAIDGTGPEELRTVMQLELQNRADADEDVPACFECAGGFAPTMGILGAVLGLIQVMQHLGNMENVGRGIAVAFVATVYGVGSANLFFIPAAGKLRSRTRQLQRSREMAMEGVIAIAEGINPTALDARLRAFLLDDLNGKEESTNAPTTRTAKTRQSRTLAGLLR